MHPPPFRISQRLLDWPDCWIELRCICPNVSVYPCKLMAKRHGNRTFGDVIGRVKCGKCSRRPFSIYLCASAHRIKANGGPSPDWSIQLLEGHLN
jgi:hypothetical protein